MIARAFAASPSALRTAAAATTTTAASLGAFQRTRMAPMAACSVQSIARSLQTLRLTAGTPPRPLSATAPTTAMRPPVCAAAHTQRRFAVVDFRPKLTKTRKAFKGTFKIASGGTLRGTVVHTGEYGLRVVEPGRIKDKHLNAINTMVRRFLRKEKTAKLIFRIFTHRPVTAKPAETRMGKGKGAIDYYATWVSTNRILIELAGVRKELAVKALQIAAEALPLRTKIVLRDPLLDRAPRVMPSFIAKRLRQLEFDAFDRTRASVVNATA